MFKYSIILFLSLVSSPLISQTFKKTFGNSESQYIGINASGQFWLRYAELNPGSTIDEEIRSNLLDLSIRRYRLGIYGALDPKTNFKLSFGNNNVGNSLKSEPQLLDAYVKYNWKSWLGFGAGKSAWVGLSRFAAPSTSSALGGDIQFGATPLINQSDELLRKMSLFVFGQLSILDYRLVAAKPTAPEKTQPSESISFSSIAPDYQISSYVKLQLKDKENQSSPFSVGSYHGSKELLNVGFGVLFQPNTTVVANSGDTTYYHAKSVAVDVFYESKISKNIIFTSYLSYHYHNLGPDFIRQIGANNPANGQVDAPILNSKGVSRIVSGTGDNIHVDLALLRSLDKSGVQIFTSFDILKLQRIRTSSFNLETGINFIQNGHKSKWTFLYQNWSVIPESQESDISIDRKSAFVIQYQFKVG